MKSYGTIATSEDGRSWRIKSDPHVLIRLKRLFEGCEKGAIGESVLSNTPEHCKDLLWFIDRYPLVISQTDCKVLEHGSKHWEDRVHRLEELLDPDYAPPRFKLAVPAREYQQRAAAIYLSQGSLLLADDLGLGKSCTAICSLTDPRTLPACVVCYPHLQKQWEREIAKFAPALAVHIVNKSAPYPVPSFMGKSADILIVTYHKLSGWEQVLAEYCNSIIFDEAQELRREGSAKYQAAQRVAERMKFRCGLTATPIYNYGGEMFSVLNVLNPGSLGTAVEFYREWCSGSNGKVSIKNPAAFGTYIREQGLMLRRTRKDVGRELPPVVRIIHDIDSDTSALEKVADKAGELARTILAGHGLERGERMQAAEEFSNLMRQATGIAKAPFVAEYVKLLASSGETVVLCGWHRAVYEIWKYKLSELRIAMYTGEESPKAKEAARTAVMAGDIDVLIISLRSGAGLDGLQDKCRNIVFGELDWSPGVIEQCIGRLHRDGQNGDVNAYFLIADQGADPVMCRILGLKRDQVDGIRDPDADLVERLESSEDRMRVLAEDYLSRNGMLEVKNV